MKIDLTQVLKDHKGKPIKDGEEEMTLESIAYSALVQLNQAEAGLGRDDRLKRGRLAQRIVTAQGKIDLKVEEVTLIKECIAKVYGPWVVVVTEDMLEGPDLAVVKQ